MEVPLDRRPRSLLVLGFDLERDRDLDAEIDLDGLDPCDLPLSLRRIFLSRLLARFVESGALSSFIMDSLSDMLLFAPSFCEQRTLYSLLEALDLTLRC